MSCITGFLLFLKTFSLNINWFQERLQSVKLSRGNDRKIKKSLDQGGEFAALLTDLSKPFDCLPHNLIIAKLRACGFDKASLRLMHSYLTDRYQRVKINNSYSLWSLIKHGVPQGSVLDPILFNTFLCDMFFMTDNIHIANYGDDNTPYSIGRTQHDQETNFHKTSVKLLNGPMKMA